MQTGAITSYIDVAQVTLYVFWAFFAALLFYIRQEDRREGYPLENDQSGRFNTNDWLFIPGPKTFNLPHGRGMKQAPDGLRDTRPIKAERLGVYHGSPLEPLGDPMLAAVGPGSYAERLDTPDLTMEGHPKIVPMRADGSWAIALEDRDPRGMKVVYADRVAGGTVTDVWIDRSESMIRYLEVSLENGAGPVLLPITFAVFKSGLERFVYVHSILSTQAAGVPRPAHADQVTFLEEDKIAAYYGGGQLYATPRRQEPLV